APNAAPCACAIPPVCSPAVTRPRTSMPTTPPRGPTADPPTSTASPCSAAATTSWSTKAASTWPRPPSAPAPTSPATRSSTPPAAPASTSPTASTPCCTTSSNSPPDSTDRARRRWSSAHQGVGSGEPGLALIEVAQRGQVQACGHALDEGPGGHPVHVQLQP